MATVWLTYAWEDNKVNDVDFIAQELIQIGLQVKLDRWNISAGRRLWEQIEDFISNPNESDAWILFATQNSLGSEACKEEYYYAIDRALKSRGTTYPIIGLFSSSVDDSLIPLGIRTRLYVSVRDPDWKERIKAAAENKNPNIFHPKIEPYDITLYPKSLQIGSHYIIEVRPRAGTWSPFLAGIPISEKDILNPRILIGAHGRIPQMGSLSGYGEKPSEDGVWFFYYAQNEATPTQSYFIFCNEIPSRLIFGVKGGQPQYLLNQFD